MLSKHKTKTTLNWQIAIRKAQLLHTADNPLDALNISVGVEENTVRDLSISSSSPRLLVVTLH